MELEEESTFDPVEKLQQFGINASDIQKLKDGGYYTIGMVLKTPQKVRKLSFLVMANYHPLIAQELVNVKGLSEAKIEKIISVAKAMRVTLILNN